jgi:HEAT repeat protein
VLACSFLWGPQTPAETQASYVNDAVAVARQLMGTQNVFTRLAAAGALVDIGDGPALAFLLEMATSADMIVQRSAIDTLLSVQHPDGLDTIYRFAAGDPLFLGFLVESLAARPRDDMGEFLIGVLDVDNPRTRRYALQALVDSDDVPGVFERITTLANDTHIDLVTRAYAYYVLTRLGHGGDVLTQLLQIVDQGDGSEQEVAAVALGLIDTQQSKTALGVLLKSEDQRVTLAALASNAGLGSDEAVSRMVQLIAYGTAMESTVVAGSLKRLPPDLASQITEAVLTCCKLKSDVAARVLESWGWIDSDATKVYKWGLAHEHADVRLQTLWLIGQRQDRGMVEAAAGFLKDPDLAIRGMAAWAIIHVAADSYSGELQASVFEPR